MLFKLNPTTGQPLYLQLMQQIRHAVESGALRHGDQLPGIRTLAEELVISCNTVVRAYSEVVVSRNAELLVQRAHDLHASSVEVAPIGLREIFMQTVKES